MILASIPHDQTDLATTMASLGELLTDQEINLMMGEAGAADGKVTLSSITWSP